MNDPIDAVSAWLDALAAPVPSPGGGAAAALTVATAAAVTTMVAGYAPDGPDCEATRAGAGGVRAQALAAARRDAAASARLVAAYRERRADLARALHEATDASLAVAESAAPLAPLLTWLAAHGDPRLASDVAVAAHLAAGAVRAAAATAAGNLASWPDAPASLHDRLDAAHADAVALDALGR